MRCVNARSSSQLLMVFMIAIIHSDLQPDMFYLALSLSLSLHYPILAHEILFVQRAQARFGRLERKVADMRGVSGSRRGGRDGSGTRYSYSSSRGSGVGDGERPAGVSDRWRTRTTASSASGSSRSSSSSSSGMRTGKKWEDNRSSDSGSAAKSSTSPPRTRKTPGPGGRRRADDPEVEAELARLKREMGL